MFWQVSPKSPIWGSIKLVILYTIEFFSWRRLFKYLYEYIWNHNFLTKWQNWSKLQNFVAISLSLIFSYSDFLIWWVSILSPLGFSHEKIAELPGRNWKKLVVFCSLRYQKISRKNAFSFSKQKKKRENCQNEKQMYDLKILLTVSLLRISILF